MEVWLLFSTRVVVRMEVLRMKQLGENKQMQNIMKIQLLKLNRD